MVNSNLENITFDKLAKKLNINPDALKARLLVGGLTDIEQLRKVVGPYKAVYLFFESKDFSYTCYHLAEAKCRFDARPEWLELTVYNQYIPIEIIKLLETRSKRSGPKET